MHMVARPLFRKSDRLAYYWATGPLIPITQGVEMMAVDPLMSVISGADLWLIRYLRKLLHDSLHCAGADCLTDDQQQVVRGLAYFLAEYAMEARHA
jgi:hypothetical protein